MDLYLQPIDEHYFTIQGSTDGLEKELCALGAFAETDDTGFSIWKARHLHRFKFQRYIETGKIFVNWSPSLMLEVKLNDLDKNRKCISILREQLTRIGRIELKDGKKNLFQLCHLGTKNGKTYLMHAYEIMEMTNQKSPLTIFDLENRDIIANLLQNWGYLNIVDSTKHKDVNKSMMREINIVPHRNKNDFSLSSIYDSF